MPIESEARTLRLGRMVWHYARASSTSAWAVNLGVLERGLGEDHAELVAAEPADDVGVAQARAQQGRDRAEQLVAGGVAVAVVDVGEVVDVERQQRGGVAVALRVADDPLELLAEAPAVVQARERVVVGEPAQLALEALAIGDVDDLQDEVGGLAGTGQRAADLRVHDVALAMDVAGLLVEVAERAAAQRLQALPQALALLGVVERSSRRPPRRPAW